MVEQTIRWPLMTGQKLDHWTHQSGKLVILGDAAHAMVPYMSQGTVQRLIEIGPNFEDPDLTILRSRDGC